jgi:hypothetical protein
VRRDLDNAADERQALTMLLEKIKENASEFGVYEDFMRKVGKRINGKRRENAIEIPIVSKAWLEGNNGEGIELEPNQYPVALDGPPSAVDVEGLLGTFEAAFTIAISKAALVTAVRREDRELATLKKQFRERLQNLYGLFMKDVVLDEETVENMIHPSSKVRARLAVALALPPVARMAYEAIKDLYDAGLTLRHSA